MADVAGNPILTDYARIYVTVDEGGDIGSRVHGDWYILCASSVKDRVRFADATRHFNFAKEMKFRLFKKRRDEVIRYANPAIERIYYVAIRKDEEHFEPSVQKRIHENALRQIADMVLSSETARSIDIEIDHNSLIADIDAKMIFEDHPAADGREVRACAVSSCESYEMQTHDFVVGAISRLYNRLDDSYVRLLDAPKYSVMTSTSDMKRVNPASRVHKVHVDAGRHDSYCPASYLNTSIQDEHARVNGTGCGCSCTIERSPDTGNRVGNGRCD